MIEKLKENKSVILFFIISVIVLSAGFYAGVIKHPVKAEKVESIKWEKESEISTYTTEYISTTEFALTEITTETQSETSTLVQVDDTPGVIEVPNLVPANAEDPEIEISTKERTSIPGIGVCTLSVSCETILNNMDKLDKSKVSLVPADGILYKTADVDIREGDTAFSLLERELVMNNIHFEYNKTTNVYIEGIGNIYEFDCGELSGWMFKVNGEFTDTACDAYVLKPGDVVEWVYTCDMGRDVGDSYADTGEMTETVSED